MVPSSRDLPVSDASSSVSVPAPAKDSSTTSPAKLSFKTSGARLGTILMYSVAYCIATGQRLLLSMVSRLFHRLRRAVVTLPTWGGWLDTAAIALLYGCIALVVGFTAGLLSLPFPEELSREALSPRFLVGQIIPENFLTFAGFAFLVPALAEEMLFRALLIPRTEERLKRKWAWMALALGLFVVWYPFLAHFGPQYFEEGTATLLTHRSFFVLALLLGAGSTWLYRRTGSIWSPVVFHWLAVVSWKLFGGSLPSLL